MIELNIRASAEGRLVEGSLEMEVSAGVDLDVDAEARHDEYYDESPSMGEYVTKIGRRILDPTPVTAHRMVPAIEESDEAFISLTIVTIYPC